MIADLTKLTGVYAIRNSANGKQYIGSAAKSFHDRWWRHRSLLRRTKHDNKHLQRAWDKYGPDAFTFRILVICEPSDCLHYEQLLIDAERSSEQRHGYNIRPHAQSNIGIIFGPPSEQTRKKIGDAHRGKKISAETRAKLRAANLGRKHTAATRAKMSATRTGKKFSKERLAKIDGSKMRRVYTPEYRAKLSASQKGKHDGPRPPWVRKKIADGHRRRLQKINDQSRPLLSLLEPPA